MAIDIETFSSVDLKKCGVYRYVESPDFAILLLTYGIDDEPLRTIDLAQGEKIPKEFEINLRDSRVLKTAFNANFERTCLFRHFDFDSPNWECTMVRASMLGLPLSLDVCARVLNVEQKDARGKALIKYFTVPCKPTKVNGGRTCNLPAHDPVKWNEFKAYNRQDVVAEKSIRKKIEFFDIPVTEQQLWELDQRINDYGVQVDPVLVNNAIKLNGEYQALLKTEAEYLTNLSNPNSPAQLKQWLQAEMPFEVIDTLRKTDIPNLLELAPSETVRRVLELRQSMSKTSVKKYQAMASAICSDQRVRGLLQFYGANRTGRWAGRLVQVQNLPQNHLKDLDLARQIVRDGDLDALMLCYGNPSDILSQLIRTAFIAPEGKTFLVTDFSAIEARIIAWLSGEKWRMDVFNTHGKIYEASAAHMFKIPIENITKPLRQKGKIAELALGFGGGPQALITMGALTMGLTEAELPRLVSMWRNANRAIVEYWKKVENAAIHTVESGETCTLSHGISFSKQKGVLFIQLPSGRRLAYVKPRMGVNNFGSLSLIYDGMDQTTKKWGVQETYGGKLVENIVQAIARDCLADALLRMHKAGYVICMHVHDEIVSEVDDNVSHVEAVNKMLSTPITWAKGLPLRAESFLSNYYKKDD